MSETPKRTVRTPEEIYESLPLDDWYKKGIQSYESPRTPSAQEREWLQAKEDNKLPSYARAWVKGYRVRSGTKNPPPTWEAYENLGKEEEDSERW